jgi:3-hydroxy-3-methylglutaryl CoA synthase
VLLSDSPRVVEYELEKKGTWTTNVYDTFRPTARHEVGNNEVSLYSYLDALEGSYRDYLCGAEIDSVDYDGAFAFNCYHTPFPGMAFQAHRTLCNLSRPRSKAEVQESFAARVLPGLAYARRVGSTYGASNFLGICGVASSKTAKPGDGISFFSYGSGAIGEFYSAKLCPEARAAVAAMKIDAALDARREVSVEEYEAIEKKRETAIEAMDFTPDFSLPMGWYDAHYKGKKLLVLRGVKDFFRTYEWS